MARGDECKTATQANQACKHFDVAAPIKKPVNFSSSTYQSNKAQEKKQDYGAWGPIFKDKKTFTDMHFC